MAEQRRKPRPKKGPKVSPTYTKRDKGGVYPQATFGMRGDATISVRDEDLAFLSSGPGNLPFEFPAMLRLHQLVGEAGRLGKLPKGWVLEIDFHGTTFAIRAEVGTDCYKVFVKHSGEGYTKIHTEPTQGAN